MMSARDEYVTFYKCTTPLKSWQWMKTDKIQLAIYFELQRLLQNTKKILLNGESMVKSFTKWRSLLFARVWNVEKFFVCPMLNLVHNWIMSLNWWLQSTSYWVISNHNFCEDKRFNSNQLHIKLSGFLIYELLEVMKP